MSYTSGCWFTCINRALDSKDYDRFHRFLVTNLHITAQFLVADMKCFDLDLILEFFSVTFKEYKRSSILSQMYKVEFSCEILVQGGLGPYYQLLFIDSFTYPLYPFPF